MASKTFCKLIDSICAKVGLRHPVLLYENANLVVDEIGFSFSESADLHGTCIRYFCDFGELPTQYWAVAMQRLLEANYYISNAGNQTFGINYETERVVLAGRAPLEVSAEGLIDTFSSHAAMAKQWRETYLLVEPGQPLPTFSKPDNKRWLFENRQ